LAAWKLSRWLSEANGKAQPTSSTMPFGEFQLAPALMPEPAGWALEVVGAHGVTLRLRQALTLRQLMHLLRAR
jgi:hypothetical protein